MNDIPTLPKNLLIAMMIKNLFKERSTEEVRFWSASTICGRMSERIDLVCKSMRWCVVNIKRSQMLNKTSILIIIMILIFIIMTHMMSLWLLVLMSKGILWLLED